MSADNPLWEFSLALYGEAGVEDACLSLQDEAGLDVNVVLLCCFLGARGVRVDRDVLAGLAGAAEAWSREVVAPLRALRRRLKAAPVGAIDPSRAEATRRAIKAAELAAERAEQDFLFDALETAPGRDGRRAARDGLIRLNLLDYLALRDAAAPERWRHRVETLVHGVRALAASGRL